MFFTLSKVLVFFCMPSNILAILGLAGLAALAASLYRLGASLLVVTVLALAIVGWSPISTALLGLLEERFPPFVDDGTPVAGIIVLGGSFDTLTSQARGEISLNESGERLTQAIALARRHPAAQIVFTGGDWTLLGEGPSEASLAQRFFPELGLPESRITFEGQSRTTAENAERLRSIVKPDGQKRWLLVTSGYHMPRSMGTFRAAGFDVVAYPVDYRTRGGASLLRPNLTITEGLGKMDLAAREWIGLLAYWLSGRSSAFFPAP